MQNKHRAFAQVKLVQEDPVEVSRAIASKALAKTNQKDLINFFGANKQEDLLYFKAIYATCGFNLNDDVFVKDEFWAARHSPVLKPTNWQHKDTNIIGVIYAVEAQLIDGTPIDIEDENTPEEDFELVIHGVIYRYTFAKLAEEIENRSKAGEFFVSMETWFDDFDYAILEDTQTMKVVARTDSTRVLDANLRCMGGDGKYEEKRIGRVLRGMTFGGVGIVDQPANPSSRGIVHASKDEEKPTEITIMDIKEAVKAELEERAKAEKVGALEAEIVELKKQNATAGENLQRVEEKLKREEEAKTIADAILTKMCSTIDNALVAVKADTAKLEQAEDKFAAKIELLQNTVKASEDVVALQTKLSEVEKELAEAKAKVAEFEAAKAAAEKAAKVEARKQEVLSLFGDEKVTEQIMNTLAELADDAYTARIQEFKLVVAMSKPAIKYDAGVGSPDQEGASGESKVGTVREGRKLNVTAALENATVEEGVAPEGGAGANVEGPFKGMASLVISNKNNKKEE